jgi:hypothetical protein
MAPKSAQKRRSSKVKTLIETLLFSKDPRPAEIILNKAAHAVCGPRNDSYGPPIEDFKCQAAMISAYLSRTNGKEVKVTAPDIAAIMCCVKLGRQAHVPKEDNWVDLAGYAACGGEINHMEGSI